MSSVYPPACKACLFLLRVLTSSLLTSHCWFFSQCPSKFAQMHCLQYSYTENSVFIAFIPAYISSLLSWFFWPIVLLVPLSIWSFVHFHTIPSTDDILVPCLPSLLLSVCIPNCRPRWCSVHCTTTSASAHSQLYLPFMMLTLPKL